MKNDLSNSETAPATTLPESVRIPLNSLQADLEYLIGRVIADGSCGPTIVKSMRGRLDQIEAGILAPVSDCSCAQAGFPGSCDNCDAKPRSAPTPVAGLYISEPEPRESGAILVCDEHHNDIAEFYHSDHATVGQSYETALALAKQLVAGCGGVAQTGKVPISQDAATIAQTAQVIIDRLTKENEALRASQCSREAAAWIVERPSDPTFPRVFRSKGDVDALMGYANVGPLPTFEPLYRALALPSTQEKSPAQGLEAMIGEIYEG